MTSKVLSMVEEEVSLTVVGIKVVKAQIMDEKEEEIIATNQKMEYKIFK